MAASVAGEPKQRQLDSAGNGDRQVLLRSCRVERVGWSDY